LIKERTHANLGQVAREKCTKSTNERESLALLKKVCRKTTRRVKKPIPNYLSLPSFKRPGQGERQRLERRNETIHESVGKYTYEGAGGKSNLVFEYEEEHKEAGRNGALSGTPTGSSLFFAKCGGSAADRERLREREGDGGRRMMILAH